MRNTPNYNLPQYEGTDKFTKEVLNDAFSKLDTVIDDLQETFNTTSTGGALTTQEVINARNGKQNLKERIDEIDEQYEDIVTNDIPSITEKLDNVMSSSVNPTNQYYNQKCVVSFTEDDGRDTIITKIKPLADEIGVKWTFSVPTGLIDKPSQLTLAQCTQLKNEGHEIVSHTVNHVNLTTLSLDEAEKELKESSEWLLKNGFDYDVHVYPQGGNNVDIRKLARKYYKYAFDVEIPGKSNTYPITNHRLFRCEIGGNTPKTLDQLKAIVDECYINKKWLVFYMHSQYATFNDSTKQLIKDIVAYIKSKDIEILTTKKASNYFLNRIEIGEYDVFKLNNYFIVDSNGNSYINGDLPYLIASDAYSSTTPNIRFDTTPFEIGFGKEITHIIKTIHPDISLFPNGKYGFLVSKFPYSSKEFHYQYYYAVNNKTDIDIYVRKYIGGSNGYGGQWTEFKRISFYNETVYYGAVNEFDGNTPITSFTRLCPIFINQVTTSIASTTGLPESTGGTLITYMSADNTSSGNYGYAFQEYTVFKKNKKYRRVHNGSNFGEWVTNASIIEHTTSAITVGTVVANSTKDITISIPGLTRKDTVTIGVEGVLESGIIVNAFVSTIDTVLIRFGNLKNIDQPVLDRVYHLKIIKNL